MTNRRDFIKNTSVLGLSGLIISPEDLFNFSEPGELLYNGIRLPANWPPKDIDPGNYEPMDLPYLRNPPAIIPIDVGRQLFVDDFLIEKTSLKRQFYNARKLDTNPVLKPETWVEQGPWGIPGATAKDGGVWWDPRDRLFKIWYEAGWLYKMAYATSKDGIHWDRPEIGIDGGTNVVVPDIIADSSTVFLDHFTNDPEERFKMFLRPPNNVPGEKKVFYTGSAMVSADGIHWKKRVETGICGDRTTIFYNPFRKKWVYSLRNTGQYGKSPIGRSRYYYEHDDFLKGAQWDIKDIAFWTGADKLDLPDPAIGDKAQLYNLSAVGYESIMLGLHQVHLGPDNEICLKNATPKITELKISFSRDGFHWDRPNRDIFINATRTEGSWDRGYVQSVGGICAVVGDQLWFYYIGFKGDQTKKNSTYVKNGMHSFGSTGIAVLRRDGFASMNADSKGGSLVTRPVTFNGKHLFVNADCKGGELKAEITDEKNRTISPFTFSRCEAVSGDSTIQKISWRGVEDLSALNGRPVRFRFQLKNGKLYSFWVSPDQNGASHGYVAAGGPGFMGGSDTVGQGSYSTAQSFRL
ncbi:MAG: hypothetical protein KIT80_09865 [Chitinophagaceae bacterium]|nr:hypothetical protein [Chitinophagaceae bacterium]MCW5927206.1 hypothetical protein [Chitinophagaceae bacterium]